MGREMAIRLTNKRDWKQIHQKEGMGVNVNLYNKLRDFSLNF
jgi:hypothetical protein